MGQGRETAMLTRRQGLFNIIEIPWKNHSSHYSKTSLCIKLIYYATSKLHVPF